MMVKLINALTGTEMFVPKARLPEYLAAGHRLAEDKPAAPAQEKPAKPKAAKKPKA